MHAYTVSMVGVVNMQAPIVSSPADTHALQANPAAALL